LLKQVTNKIRKGRPKKTIENDKQKIAKLEMENAVLKKYNELLMEEEIKLAIGFIHYYHL
jgi:hypothetical protein